MYNPSAANVQAQIASLKKEAREAREKREQQLIEAEIKGLKIKLTEAEQYDRLQRSIEEDEKRLGVDGRMPGEVREPVVVSGTTAHNAWSKPTISWVPQNK